MVHRHERRRVSPERTHPSAFWVLAALAIPLFSVFAKIDVVDEDKLPRSGAFVLAPNHHSEIDPLVVAIAVWRLGRAPRFMAKESLFRAPVVGWALRSTGMIPVPRQASRADSGHALQTARTLVEHGRGVIVYPEGTLTRDPDLWPMRGKTGAVRLAAAGGIPLIPVAQWGAQELLPRYGKPRLWPLRKRMTVVFGDPVSLPELSDDHPQQVSLAAATTRLMDAIAALLADLRGIPAPAERWNPAAHGQKETGRLEP